MLGKPLTVVEGQRSWQGTGVDVADDGALLVRDDVGATRRLYAGDVTVRYDE